MIVSTSSTCFFLTLAVDGDRPGTRLEVLGQPGGFVLVSRKFVVVVVVGDVLVGSDGFSGREGTLLDAVNLRIGLRHGRRRSHFVQAHSGRHRRRARQRRTGQKLPPVQVKAFRGDLGGWNIGRLLDQHEGKLLKGVRTNRQLRMSGFQYLLSRTHLAGKSCMASGGCDKPKSIDLTVLIPARPARRRPRLGPGGERFADPPDLVALGRGRARELEAVAQSVAISHQRPEFDGERRQGQQTAPWRQLPRAPVRRSRLRQCRLPPVRSIVPKTKYSLRRERRVRRREHRACSEESGATFWNQICGRSKKRS